MSDSYVPDAVLVTQDITVKKNKHKSVPLWSLHSIEE